MGEVPTPLLYFACHKLESQSGVIITGSHNPAEYNGLKIVINGDTLSEHKIQHLKTVIETSGFKSGEGQLSEAEIIPQYLEYISEDVILATSPKVVVDCGNGVAGAVAPQLLTELGCEVIPLYCEVDGNFPNHHPDPSKEENLQDLIKAVKDNEADLGLAFDGDGDRIGVVTNKGKIIWPDRLMMLYAKDLLIRNPGADIIFDVKCSRNLAELISSLGGRPLMWKTGHSLIKNKLKETNASLAGEMSGHIFFNDRWFGFDDGLYSAARLLEILTTELQTSDEIFAELPEDLSTPEIAIPVSEESKFSIIEQLTQQGQFGKGKISHLDGVRVDFPKAWGLVRASNTTPTLTARFEAQNPEALQQIQALFKNQLLAVDDSLDLPF
ncbi:MAG: phosphomannomutase/phosphoglucomutase [Moraxellaceae bacterium]|nr:MAG: phosphomannomutase/phosphoglucomutase [Moraxellaceae bacterium]